MKELIESFSPAEILIIIFMLAIAGKEVLGLKDWWNERLSKKYEKDSEAEKVQDGIESGREDRAEIKAQMKKLSDLVEMLIESDKESIKSDITTKHHYLCYEL